VTSGLVTLGETMAVLSTPGVGRLRHARSLDLGVAGAESTVAIGVRRLGGRATWVGRVGDDEFGQLVRATLAGEGVSVDHVVVDGEARTGLMIKERRTGTSTRVVYYRAGSAGSRLCPDDVETGLVRSAGVLHLTGITPALSDAARAAVHAAVDTAAEAGVPVSLDLNYRRALWSPDAAARTLRDLVRRAEVLFATDDEARLLVGGTAPHDLAGALAALGPRHVLVKLGARGAVALVDGAVREVPPRPTVVVDPVGAGDAFAAAYLAGLLDGATPERRLSDAAAAGAFAVAAAGDWEGLPDRAELAAASAEDVTR
jgi:2-dehydro-3-deoxygluconokinase